MISLGSNTVKGHSEAGVHTPKHSLAGARLTKSVFSVIDMSPRGMAARENAVLL